MDAVEAVARALVVATCCEECEPEWETWRPASEAVAAALLALGDGDPVVLMPAAEDGRVEVRRAHMGVPFCGHPQFRLVPIEDGEG